MSVSDVRYIYQSIIPTSVPQSRLIYDVVCDQNKCYLPVEPGSCPGPGRHSPLQRILSSTLDIPYYSTYWSSVHNTMSSPSYKSTIPHSILSHTLAENSRPIIYLYCSASFSHLAHSSTNLVYHALLIPPSHLPILFPSPPVKLQHNTP